MRNSEHSKRKRARNRGTEASMRASKASEVTREAARERELVGKTIATCIGGSSCIRVSKCIDVCAAKALARTE